MRKLWYVPTLHTVHETVSPYDKTPVRSLPPDLRRDHADIMRTWALVRRVIARHIAAGRINPRRLHVFCDGITTPPGGAYRLGRARKPTMRTLRWLRSKGARLRGTESKIFLLAHGLHILKHPARTGYSEKRLMYLRDVFIALEILKAVPAGHDAICFMGDRHKVDRHVARMAPELVIERIGHFRRLNKEIRRR